MGRHVDAQLNNDSEYVKAVCTSVHKIAQFYSDIFFLQFGFKTESVASSKRDRLNRGSNRNFSSSSIRWQKPSRSVLTFFMVSQIR